MITIMTPVYNRAYIIEKLYQSLLRQTSHDFDWLIVDDGSTDNLKELVFKWKEDNARFFDLQYIYRENGGKHRAWNTALPYIKGEWTFVVDSDDYLTDDAIEKIEGWIQQIQDDMRFAGVAGCKGDIDGKIIGGRLHGKTYFDASNLERYKKQLQGDKAEVYRTDILRKYPFPEFEGEKFCSEGAVYGPIAVEGYILRWFSDVVYIADYQSGGLSKNQLKDRLSYFQGYTYVMRNQALYEEFPIKCLNIKQYCDCARLKGQARCEVSKNLGISLLKCNILFLFGLIIDLLLRIKHAGENSKG